MFIGHFGVGLAAKRAAPRASLPVLMIAPQFSDVLWPIFNLIGIEHTHIVPGITAASPLSLDYLPYSHSLVSSVIQSIAFAAIYLAITRDRRAAIVLGLVVFSHWVLDWISHGPDMPILHGDGPRYGLGLWNSIPATIAVEGGLFALGCAIYARMTRAKDRAGAIGWWAMVAVLAVAFVGSIFGPPPPSMDAMLAMAFGLLIVIVPVTWWIDRHREDVRP
jgi:hypothetical protein